MGDKIFIAAALLLMLTLGMQLGIIVEERKRNHVVAITLDECEDACSPQPPKEFR